MPISTCAREGDVSVAAEQRARWPESNPHRADRCHHDHANVADGPRVSRLHGKSRVPANIEHRHLAADLTMRKAGAVALKFRVAEYFAGIGLARLGLEQAGMEVVWSNDISDKKARMFASHFGDAEPSHSFELTDLRNVSAASLPTDVSVAWASFPCKDLSIAGGRAGLHKGSKFCFLAIRQAPRRPGHESATSRRA